MDRRRFLGLAATVPFLPLTRGARAAGSAAPFAAALPPVAPAPFENPPRILRAVKIGMVQVEGGFREKFQVLKEIGFDGVELDSPTDADLAEARAASLEVGLPIHGVVNSIHWGVRLSDPDPAVRARSVAGLEQALRDAHFLGGSAVLLVPGAVRDAQVENQDQVWERSILGIRSVLPLAARLGVRVLIENVWNGFCYVHDGPNDQTADRLVEYLDAIDSPWVGSYFDIGNHQKYGKPAEWIRRLGRRIVKLDVKDWGTKAGFCKIGDGDLDWAAVREALAEIRYTGWATAEVGGGGKERLAEIHERMGKVLGL